MVSAICAGREEDAETAMRDLINSAQGAVLPAALEWVRKMMGAGVEG